MPAIDLAYLSQRKLHLHKDGVTRTLESEFERTVRERTASIERRNSWKTQGRGATFQGAAGLAQQAASRQTPVLITGLTLAPEGGLLYSLETDSISGIFLRDAAGVETRLFHTADFRIRHAALHSDGATLAATAFHNDSMRSNIALLPLHGTDFSEVTEGDSFDQLPAWVPGGGRRVVFQSAGVGRDAAGNFAGLGPCTIHRLDAESGDLDEIAAEDGKDLLQPRETEDGTLYYIRKPYESGAPQASLLGSIGDAAMFPFRMARAILQYFNIFSMMYTGKPLVTNKGAVQRPIDPRQALIYGNLAHAMMQQQQGDDDQQGLVPSSWELVRKRPGERAETVAKNVLAFDVAGERVVCSNGRSIQAIGPDGHSQRLLEGELIDRIVAL
jgi:hypothetical protein